MDDAPYFFFCRIRLVQQTRKEYQCFDCRRPILKGSRCFYTVLKDDDIDKLQVYRRHAHHCLDEF